MKKVHLDQAGPDWHRWRAQGLGGSDASAVMGGVKWTSPEELMEVKLGLATVEENDAMRRGKLLEPAARVLYQQLTGVRVTPCCVVHDEYEWLRASLDGLSEDGKLVLEIKCPTSPHGHRVALGGKVPSYYVAQTQHQLLVTGAPLLHFFSYHPDYPGPPETRYALVPVTPDEEYQKRLFEKERRFWQDLRMKALRIKPSLLLPVLLPESEKT